MVQMRFAVVNISFLHLGDPAGYDWRPGLTMFGFRDFVRYLWTVNVRLVQS